MNKRYRKNHMQYLISKLNSFQTLPEEMIYQDIMLSFISIMIDRGSDINRRLDII